MISIVACCHSLYCCLQQQKCCRRRPTSPIVQLNTEGLTENKISVIEQLAYRKKAFIMILQENEIHCIIADKLVIPNFSLAGSILSRNHGLATFAHKRLEWSLVNQSPEQSETEWLCVDVAGYKIINVYKPQRPSRRFHTPVCILVISTTSMSTGVTTSPDGESLDSWATSNNFVLLHNQKETASFFFRRWKVDTNPDLAFARFGQDPTA